MSLADVFFANPAAQKALAAFEEADAKRKADTLAILVALADQVAFEAREQALSSACERPRKPISGIAESYLDRVLSAAGHFEAVKHAAAIGGLGLVKDVIAKFEERVRGKPGDAK